MIEIVKMGSLPCQSCKSSHEVRVVFIGLNKQDATAIRLCYSCRKQLSKMLLKNK